MGLPKMRTTPDAKAEEHPPTPEKAPGDRAGIEARQVIK